MGQRNGILLYAGAATFLFLLVPPVTAGITFIASIGTLESALRDSAQQLAEKNHGLKQFIDTQVSAILDICKRMENINGDNYEAYQRALENTKVELQVTSSPEAMLNCAIRW